MKYLQAASMARANKKYRSHCMRKLSINFMCESCSVARPAAHDNNCGKRLSYLSVWLTEHEAAHRVSSLAGASGVAEPEIV